MKLLPGIKKCITLSLGSFARKKILNFYVTLVSVVLFKNKEKIPKYKLLFKTESLLLNLYSANSRVRKHNHH